ncbi:MAG: toll/interleukin-1 receptor domain-containing protein [Rhodanobacteraceae bacterium]|nr:MAG: toll/interleukin-1 receptor domain-containing protein [Rhodanobacteraceae bacterium]
MPESSSGSSFTYRAFISYSHGDKAWADWLHKALETYRVPSRLVGKPTDAGVIPRRLNPVFRDREELSSSPELGSKINEALAKSENLIVLCSPASAASRWVNEEVLAYKRMGRSGRIFCLIVAGEPNATDLPGRAAEECFCPALRFATDVDGRPTNERTEPIAADAREGKDGKANAKLKLIAGMLGVGFDALKQRELQRRTRRMTAIAALALGVMAITSVLAVYALISRHEAVVAQQAAQRRQKQAEGLVGFMLGDLNDKLLQVNRLDIMQAVDGKALAYFKSLPNNDVNDTALAQRAKALEKIGSVRLELGNFTGALDAFRSSTAVSSKLAATSPRDVARQIAYSRTLTFIGFTHWNQGKLDDAQRAFESAHQTLQTSLSHAPKDPSLLVQLSSTDNNIGHVLEARGQFAAAELAYQHTLDEIQEAVAAKPDDAHYLSELGDARNNLGKLALERGDLATAILEYRYSDAIETNLSARDPRNNNQREGMLRVHAILGRALSLAGETTAGKHDLQRSVDIATQLTRFEPNETDFQNHLALYSSQLARLQRLDGDMRTAVASNSRAIAIMVALIKKTPGNRIWQSEYAEALIEQAAEQHHVGNADAARSSARNALDILEPILAKQPDERGTMLDTMTAKLLLAAVIDDPVAARNQREEVLQAMQRVKIDDGDPRLLALRIEALLALGRAAKAQPLIKQLWNEGYRDPEFVALLQHEHIAYPVNTAFHVRLLAAANADNSEAASQAGVKVH